jgi:membrane-associated protease RseP (regulator of RpoE activity)
MRFGLRTLLILLAILPPLLWVGWTKYSEWKAEQERRKSLELMLQAIPDGGTVYMFGRAIDVPEMPSPPEPAARKE